MSGKGGVGRTSVAAILGLLLAGEGRRVLVATTGHDDRLAWMLGGDSLSNVPARVAPELWIQRLVPAHCLREYGSLVLRSRRLSRAVFGNRVVRRLLDAVPGVDDFSVLGKVWHEATRAGRFDLVILDGPATGHLRLALGVPQAIVDTVFEGPLAREAAEIRSSLRDPEVSAAVLVSVAERWPLTELAELAEALHGEIGLGVASLVVNKLWPASLPPLTPASLSNVASRCEFQAADDSCHRGRRQRAALETWLSFHQGAPWLGAGVVELPWRAAGLESPSALHEVLRGLGAEGRSQRPRVQL